MNNKRNDNNCRRRFWFIVFGVFVMLFPAINPIEIISLSCVSARAQEAVESRTSSDGEASQNEPAPAVQKLANPSVSAVTQAAVKLGILSCVSRINQVATFLTANVNSGVYIFSPKSQPDQHIFSTSFELIRPDDSTLYASASFFPNQDAVYDTVEYVSVRPEELEKTVFKDLKRVNVLRKNIVMLDGGNVKVFIMPAGSGSVVIKKEVIQ